MTSPEHQKIEILVSTMRQSSSNFLKPMFTHNDVEGFQFLIVNQTDGDTLIQAEKSIRIIHSQAYGLAKSRNIAIENATASIGLFADDDVVYLPNLRTKILEGFQTYPDADIITFQMVDLEGNYFRNYPEIVKHTKKTIQTVNSVIIAFRCKRLQESTVRFDELFGLGGEFETADEYIFLRSALDAGLKVYFNDQIILKHPYESSGKAAASDRVIYARAALFYKYSGILGYLKLFRYLFAVYRRGMIRFNDVVSKIRVGHKGIKKFKSLKLVDHK